MNKSEKKSLYLVGDVKYTSSASPIYKDNKDPEKFLLDLQSLMEKYGVVKLDVSTDAFEFTNCKRQ